MVHECQHIYETGRKCRRIPKRGEDLCPGHRPNHRPDRRCSAHDDPAFSRQLEAFAAQLQTIDSCGLLSCLQDALTDIQPIVERKSSRATYAPFARASIVIAIALDRLIEGTQALTATLSETGTPPPFEY